LVEQLGCRMRAAARPGATSAMRLMIGERWARILELAPVEQAPVDLRHDPRQISDKPARRSAADG
jgi:hypothetical protein